MFLFVAQLATLSTLHMSSVFVPGSDVVRFTTFRALSTCNSYTGSALTGDVTLLVTHCHRGVYRRALSSCVTSLSVDRCTCRCLCWCSLLSLTGLGSRLIRVVDRRALLVGRIGENMFTSGRKCNFSIKLPNIFITLQAGSPRPERRRPDPSACGRLFRFGGLVLAVRL